MARRIGDYEVLAGPFAGGFGEVYKVLDRSWCEEFALKTIKGSFLSSSRRLRRFRSELDLWTQLPSHRHVVRAIEAFEDGGRPYLLMEWVDGQSLDNAMTGIDAVLAIAILRQIADGMQHVHRHGIVHGDLKPNNVLVTPLNCAKVTDFGLAQLESTSQRSSTAGSIRFMAPELRRGHSPSVASDIFSAGRTLLDVVSQFDESDFGIAAVRALATRMIDSDPSRRPGSFREVTDVLQETLKTAPDSPPIILTGGVETFKERTISAALPAKQLLTAARSHVSAGRSAEAIDTLRLLLKESPSDDDGLLMMAELLSAAGDHVGAREYLRSAEGVARANNVRLFNVAVTYLNLGRVERAKAICEDLQRDKKLKARVLQLRGDIADREGDLSEAIDRYRQASRDGAGSSALLGLARSLGTAGRIDEAIEALNSIEPEDPQIGVRALLLKAKLLVNVERHEAAARILLECLKNDLGDSMSAYVYAELGHVYMKQALNDAAYASYQRSIDLEPSNRVVSKRIKQLKMKLHG